jgi:broad-specificity NMP kinase
MSGSEAGVVWIAGAPGAGKSTAAWALCRRLAEQGIRPAYVDIDQLGMLYPAPHDDPGRYRLKANAFDALLPGYLAHGAQVVIVSGVIDPAPGAPLGLSSASNITLVTLAPDREDLRQRLLARGVESAEIDDAVAENDMLRATFPDSVIDTGGLSVAATVDRLLPSVRLGIGTSSEQEPVPASTSDLGIVAVTGPRAVGSSTVGYGFASRRWRNGEPTAFVDPEQLSFIGDIDVQGSHALAVRQLAAFHEFMSSRGAGLLVVSGPPSVAKADSLSAAAPAAPHLVVRLRADPSTIRGHIRLRAQGGGACLAGDDLLGADAKCQERVAAASLEQQPLLEEGAPKDEHVLDVTGRSADETVDELELLTAARPRR